MYKKIIINTFDTIFKNQNRLLEKLIVPIIILTLINYYLPQFINKEIISNFNINNFKFETFIIPILLFFLLIMLNISIAVTTHRVTILGPTSVPTFGGFIIGLKELKFLFKSILMTIIIAIPVILSFFIPVVGPFVSLALIFILFSRLSLIYPAISCDKKMSFYQAWKYTKNYKIITFFAVILFPVIFSFTVGFIYTLIIEVLIKLVSEHLVILYSILNVFILVFSISALSNLYILVKPESLNKIKEENIHEKEISVSKRKNLHKVIIEDTYTVTFNSLKKELIKQYEKLNFNDLVLDREKSFLLKNPLNEEAYVSLRYDGNEFIIQTNHTEEPKLEILNS